MVLAAVLPILPASMVSVITPLAPTEAAETRLVAEKVGMPDVAALAVVQLVSTPSCCAQMATAFFSASTLATAEAAFDLDV